MPEMPRYTIRLPLALAAQVEAHIAAGTPFPVLIREALSYQPSTPVCKSRPLNPACSR